MCDLPLDGVWHFFFRCFTEQSFSCFNIIIYLRHRLLILYRDRMFSFCATRWFLHTLDRQMIFSTTPGQASEVWQSNQGVHLQRPPGLVTLLQIIYIFSTAATPVHFARHCSIGKMAEEKEQWWNPAQWDFRKVHSAFLCNGTRGQESVLLNPSFHHLSLTETYPRSACLPLSCNLWSFSPSSGSWCSTRIAAARNLNYFHR